MAPEQAVGHTGGADHRADQYALAVMVYEMLSGQLPFDGDDVLAVLYQVVHERAPALSEVAPPWVPRAVSDVVARAMAKRPGDRFATVTDFAAALARASGCALPTSLQQTSPALSVPDWVTRPTSSRRSSTGPASRADHRGPRRRGRGGGRPGAQRARQGRGGACRALCRDGPGGRRARRGRRSRSCAGAVDTGARAGVRGEAGRSAFGARGSSVCPLRRKEG